MALRFPARGGRGPGVGPGIRRGPRPIIGREGGRGPIQVKRPIMGPVRVKAPVRPPYGGGRQPMPIGNPIRPIGPEPVRPGGPTLIPVRPPGGYPPIGSPIIRDGGGGNGYNPPGGFPTPPWGGGGLDGGYPIRPPGMPYPPAQGGPVPVRGGPFYPGGNPDGPPRLFGTGPGMRDFQPGPYNNPVNMSHLLTQAAFNAQHPVDQALGDGHGLHPAQVQLLRDHYDNNLLHQTLASQGGGMGFAPQRPGVMY